MIAIIFPSPTPELWWLVKRKCGADFIWLIEGCGKTRKKTNDIQYPTLVQIWGMRGYYIPYPHNPNKNECCPSSFLPWKLPHFLRRTVKTLSSVCNAGSPTSTKIENISDKWTTLMEYWISNFVFIFYQSNLFLYRCIGVQQGIAFSNPGICFRIVNKKGFTQVSKSLLSCWFTGFSSPCEPSGPSSLFSPSSLFGPSGLSGLSVCSDYFPALIAACAAARRAIGTRNGEHDT